MTEGQQQHEQPVAASPVQGNVKKMRGNWSRRAFLLSAVAVCGGLEIGLRVSRFNAKPAIAPESVEIDNWIVIAPDNTVTIRVAQMELGQGGMSTMAQLLAEELEIDWSKVRLEFVSIARHLDLGKFFGRTETAASSGVRSSELLLRTAGVQIRTMLVKAAAERFGVSESELAAENSIITHRYTGRQLTYGELAADAARVPVPDPASVMLKDPNNWKYIGKSMRRLDIPSKSDGSAIFGIDVRLPGMKYAAIMISPVFGGRLVSHDDGAVLSRPSVRKVVEIKGGKTGFVEDMDDAIAVVADDWWQAKTALDAITKVWDGGQRAVDSAKIMASFRLGLDHVPHKIVRKQGDVEAALSSAPRSIQAEYFVPYLEQATLEPMNCTALVRDNGFEVWAATQVPELAMETAAKVAGFPISRGELHVTFGGGGFGRRLYSDYVSQAVQIAKAMQGTPVKLVWTREETMRHSFYRPASLSRVRGGIDLEGNISAWCHRIVAHADRVEYSSYGADNILYAIPNLLVDLVAMPSHVPTGAMRGIEYAMNCFVTQSFVDELARAAGKDTYQFQKSLLDPHKERADVPKTSLDDNLTTEERSKRLRTVLDNVAIKANWGEPLGPNRGRGIAAHEEDGSFFAAVVEVTLDGSGWFTVDRVVIVSDPGLLANPDNARAQVEGSIVFGLTSAMYGEITFRDGQVVEGNFNDYRMLRIDEMPQVEIHWILGRRFWGDVSEAAVGVVIPALTNAIYDAGGPRIRSLPIKNHRVLKRDNRT
jgi:isoquinoline 1-oxidoreductase subunit beta